MYQSYIFWRLPTTPMSLRAQSLPEQSGGISAAGPDSGVATGHAGAGLPPLSSATRNAAPSQAAGSGADLRIARAKPSGTSRQTIAWLRHWTPTLLSLRVTRDSAFDFTPGHYARVSIPGPSGPRVARPLSIASAPADPQLEFFCTLIAGGEFSGRLAACRAGDAIEVDTASYGFLTVDSLAPGTDLWLLATGTGLAPYLSMLRDPRVWSAFERLVVVHSVRYAAELAYADELRRFAQGGAGTPAFARLRYLPVVTREAGASTLSERIPALLEDDRLSRAAGAALDPAHSRVMVCGNPDMTRALRSLLGERGFRTTRRGAPGQMAFEK